MTPEAWGGARLINSIALRIRQSLKLDEILNATVMEVRELLEVDRVFIYCFNENWSGIINVESVNSPQWSILGRTIEYPCFKHSYIRKYEEGIIRSIDDIYTAEIPECHRQLLAQFQVRANLVVPIVLKEEKQANNNRLWGLLIAHQCSAPRRWQKLEIELLVGLANQVAIAIQQAELLAKKDKAVEKWQQAAASWQESEQRYRLLAENATDMISQQDLEGVYLYVSPASKLLLGYEPQELIGCQAYDFFHPEDLEQIRASHEAIVQSEVGQIVVYRIRRQDGSYIWFETSSRTITDPDTGELKGILAISRDVSDRVLAEQALQQLNRELEDRVKERTAALQKSERTFRSLFESAPDFIYILDTQGIIQQVNSTVLRESGYSPSELIGNHLIHFLTCRWQQIGPEQFPILLQQGTHRQEMEFVCKNGKIITVDCSCSVVGNPKEKAYILVLQRDISEKKQTEAKLRENERRWRTLLEDVRLIVVALDRWGKIEYANPFFLELVEYSSWEVLGKNWWTNFVPKHEQLDNQEYFNQFLKQNCKPHYQHSILTKSGEERLIAWNNALLRNELGEAMGMMSIGEDITERYAIAKMKDEFISVVSHELRTPLTSIYGALNLLSKGLVDGKSPKGVQLMKIATDSTDRLVRLVNDILELERLESGKIKLWKEKVNVAYLMEQATAQIEVMASRAGVLLEVNSLNLEIYVDGHRLIQVLTNLLDNAVKFSPARAKVKLSAVLRDSMLNSAVLFQVEDEGQGIPSDKQKSIFERFHQVDASDSRKKGGTGLGLAICRSIVQQHGGEIWVESNLGQGSTFYFTVPPEEEK